MKKTVSIFLLIVVCCAFAPMVVAATGNQVFDANPASYMEETSVSSDAESIHSEGIESYSHQRMGESAFTTSIVNPEPEYSKFSWGWVMALTVLLGAGGIVVLVNRIKK